MAGKILIVDDEKDMLALLKRIISEETAHEITVQTDPLAALELFRTGAFDLVMTDLKMPKMNGLRLLEEMKKLRPQVSVVMLTAYATIETAVEAIQKGAYDYITKPFRRERVLLTVDKVMKWQEMVRENLALHQMLAEKGDFPPLVGSTPMMKDICERIRQVAPTMGTVLITGASGTGKELVARAIFQQSHRSARKFVTINCTALPEEMIESELFGHVKGAFTGAWKDKRGLVAEAHEGTLFLDEIGDLSPQMQAKLLRLIQEGEYKPVGSVDTQQTDVRFIAATNQNLRQAIRERRFREDLYYRLNVIRFELPSLKERKPDIPLLCYYFLTKYTTVNQKNISEISPAALQALLAYDFPGNVRELENIIERGVIFCRSTVLEVGDLGLENDQDPLYSRIGDDIQQLCYKDAKERMIQRFHKQYIELLLQESVGNVSKAAGKAGIQRQYLHRLIKEAGVEPEVFKGKIEDKG